MKKILAGAAVIAAVLAGAAGPAHAGIGANGWGNGISLNGWGNGVNLNGWGNGVTRNGWGNGVARTGVNAKGAEAGKAALVTVAPTVTAVRLPGGATVAVQAR